MSTFFRHSVPFYVPIITAIFSGVIVWQIKGTKSGAGKSAVSSTVTTSSGPSACMPLPARVVGYNYIAPLLLIESKCESPELARLKNSLTSFIDQQKATDVLKDASFYFRDIEEMQWTGYNQDEKYFPGSLMKVPDMMSLLVKEEKSPGILSTKLYYAKPFAADKSPLFISKKLDEEKYYTIEELLKYEIAYSDNNATMLLSNNLGEKEFNKLLADFRLPAADSTKKHYLISPKDFSMFMRSIYNSSYLSTSHSELAAEWLSECDFKDGFLKGLPPGTKLIHKFGEYGGADEKQLHESAIFYISGHPYLLTVMTKGNDFSKLTNVLSGMAAIVYKSLMDDDLICSKSL